MEAAYTEYVWHWAYVPKSNSKKKSEVRVASQTQPQDIARKAQSETAPEAKKYLALSVHHSEV